MMDFIVGFTCFVCSVITIIIINRFFFDFYKNNEQFSPYIFFALCLFNFFTCTLISILFAFIVGENFRDGWDLFALIFYLIIFIVVGTISGVINGFILRNYIRSKFKNSKYNLKIIPLIFILALMVAIPSFIIKWEQYSRNYQRTINRQENEYKLKAENWALKEKLKKKEIISSETIKKNQPIENELKNTRENSGRQEEIDPQAFLYEKPTKEIQILRSGEFFGGDINDGAEKLVWYGLFEQEGKFILKKTKILIEPTSWGGDEGDQKNGKLVTSTIETGAPIIFITGLKDIQEGEIESVKLEKSTLKPGESFDVSFNDYHITFSAYGAILPGRGLTDYQLAIRSVRYGPESEPYGPKYESKSQIFAGRKDGCDGTMYSFYWAGDIDRDGLLDLILDLNDGDCNDVRVTLFLSSKAEDGKLIKKMAEFRTTAYRGC